MAKALRLTLSEEAELRAICSCMSCCSCATGSSGVGAMSAQFPAATCGYLSSAQIFFK